MEWFFFIPLLSVAQPGDSTSLRILLNVGHKELGKPNKPHTCIWYGIPTVRKGEGLVGRGCWKKRMPYCNGVDRAVVSRELQRYLTRKGADFLSRSQRKKHIEKSLLEVKLDDV